MEVNGMGKMITLGLTLITVAVVAALFKWFTLATLVGVFLFLTGTGQAWTMPIDDYELRIRSKPRRRRR
jgi:hypothetical protein